MDNICHMFDANNKTIELLFLNCPFARAIWYGSPFSFRMDQSATNCFATWWNSWTERNSSGVIDQAQII